MVKLLEQPVIYDGRNIWNVEMTGKHGLEYHGIGSRRVADVRK
jgi:hypothetical protein